MKKTKQELEQELTAVLTDMAKLEEKHRAIEAVLGKDAVAKLIEINEALSPGFGETLLDRAREVISEAAEVEELKTTNDTLAEQVIDLYAALDAAIEDRNQMLKRLGLTDFEWSCQGGNSYADVDV